MTEAEAAEKLFHALTHPIAPGYATRRPQWADYLAPDGTIRGLEQLEVRTEAAMWMEDEDGAPVEVEAMVLVVCPSREGTLFTRMFTVADIAVTEPDVLGLQYFLDWVRAHERAQARREPVRKT